MRELERASSRLAAEPEAIVATHDRVMRYLSGGSAEVLRSTHAGFALAQSTVESAVADLRLAHDDLRAHLSTL